MFYTSVENACEMVFNLGYVVFHGMAPELGNYIFFTAEYDNSGFMQARNMMSEPLNPFAARRSDDGNGMMRSMDPYMVPQGIPAPAAMRRDEDAFAGSMNSGYASAQPGRMQGRDFTGAMPVGRDMMLRGGREPVGTDDLRPQAIEEDRSSPVPETKLLHDFQVLLDKIIETTPSKQVIYLRPCILYPPPPGTVGR